MARGEGKLQDEQEQWCSWLMDWWCGGGSDADGDACRFLV